jgi:dGTPase
MESLQKRLDDANTLLSPYAISHEGTLGREHKEEVDEIRFPFERDRGRITHSFSFRRLQGKTQVFVTGSGDHYRTRLTHTMEVAQLSRNIARALGLNEDLAECIALAHDLGHPPFGHSGEDALNAWMKDKGSHFEHNEQSERIVTVLEEHSPLFLGLNLNREVIEGIRKHSGGTHSLEAQVVNIADEIVYTAHDCEDGLGEGLFSLKELLTTQLAQSADLHRQKKKTSLRGAIIDILAHDLFKNSDSKKIAFSQQTQDLLREIRPFLWDNMYLHPTVRAKTKEGEEILEELCDKLFANPSQKIKDLQNRTQSSLLEAVKDYVAGMTDTYAKDTLTVLHK